jgi:outer membrane murein-binding lipoprotein Lpp
MSQLREVQRLKAENQQLRSEIQRLQAENQAAKKKEIAYRREQDDREGNRLDRLMLRKA